MIVSQRSTPAVHIGEVMEAVKLHSDLCQWTWKNDVEMCKPLLSETFSDAFRARTRFTFGSASSQGGVL